MRTQNLTSVSCHVVAAYGNTARHAIKAYRRGGERVIKLVEQRWDRALAVSRPKLAAGVARNAGAVQARLQRLAQSGLTLSSDGAVSLVDKAVQLVDASVHAVADNALWLEDKAGVKPFSRLSQLALPAATVVSQFADQLEDQTALLAAKVAGRPTVKPVASRTRRAVRKTATAVAAA